jgi:TonB-linked SusC/RagA family outer membrane protein
MYLNAHFKGNRILCALISSTAKVMQLTAIVLLAACLQVCATARAQKVTISGKNISLKEIFTEIRSQTGYNFIYSNEDLQNVTPVTLHVKNGDLREVLDRCFDRQPLGYSIVEKIIIVKPKAPELPVVSAVTGTVTDAASGKPLPSVSVQVKGTSKGIATDEKGHYRLEAPDNAVLVFSYLGYVKKEVPVAGQATLNIALVPSNTGLNEVIVVGYGTQRKEDLSGSVSSINYDQQLQNRAITDVSQALSGMAPGISVSQTSGQPGRDGAVVRIRGVGTLNNSDPLVLIDGIVGSLNNVNPNDVASISILKDAASAAIYGSRAANGVILVTTKRGKQGKTVINYNGSAGLERATHLFKPVTDYVTYMQLMNRIQKSDNPDNADLFQPGTIDAWKNATDPVLFPNTNWMDVIFGQGVVTKHNLSVSGGNDKTDYYLSMGYLYNKGIIASTDAQKYSLRLNLNHKISDKIKIGANLNSYWNKVNEPFDVTTLLYYSANSVPGTTPVMNNDGTVRYGGRNTDDESTNAINPQQYMDTWFYPQVGQYSFAKLYGEWEILKDLKWQVNGSAEIYNKESKKYKYAGAVQNLWNFQQDAVTIDNSAVPSVLDQRNDNSLALTFYTTLDYNKTFGTAHHLDVLLGASRETSKQQYFSGSVQGFPSNDTWELNAGLSQPMVAGTSSSYALSSYFGRVNYNYKEKYLLEANLRYDGSSRFAAGNRWGVFPSFSGAWRLSREDFFRNANISFVDDIKIRGSWGKLGNQNIDLYQYMGLYSAGLNYVLGNSLAAGLAPKGLPNPDITWESTATADVGADISLFRERFDLTFDWYNRKTSDILVQLPLSSLYGALTPPYQNVAVVQNRGWEVSLGYKNSAGHFRYAVNGNLSHNNNKVLHFQGNPDVIQGMGNNSIIKQGLPIGALYGYQAAGTFKNQHEIDEWAKQKLSGTNKPGDLKYMDLAADGVINGSDRTFLGSVIPEYTYGFSLQAGYKELSLSVLFQGIGGVKRYYQNLWFTSAVRYGREINSYFLHSWSPDNPESNIPRLTTDGNGDNTLASSFWVQNGAFLRVKNIQLSYTLPAKWLQKTFVTGIQVYADAQNPVTWTKYNGLDPETGDYSDYQIENPNVRIFSLGINASF